MNIQKSERIDLQDNTIYVTEFLYCGQGEIKEDLLRDTLSRLSELKSKGIDCKLSLHADDGDVILACDYNKELSIEAERKQIESQKKELIQSIKNWNKWAAEAQTKVDRIIKLLNE